MFNSGSTRSGCLDSVCNSGRRAQGMCQMGFERQDEAGFFKLPTAPGSPSRRGATADPPAQRSPEQFRSMSGSSASTSVLCAAVGSIGGNLRRNAPAAVTSTSGAPGFASTGVGRSGISTSGPAWETDVKHNACHRFSGNATGSSGVANSHLRSGSYGHDRSPRTGPFVGVATRDGFFAALLSGPAAVTPGEWMGWVRGRENGEDAPDFASGRLLRRITGLPMRHWSDVPTSLQAEAVDLLQRHAVAGIGDDISIPDLVEETRRQASNPAAKGTGRVIRVTATPPGRGQSPVVLAQRPGLNRRPATSPDRGTGGADRVQLHGASPCLRRR